MLECLEDRNLLSADVTFNFSVPSGVGNAGQTINFYIYGTLEPATQGGTGYTPSSGPDASTFIPAGTVVYLEDTSGVFDWAIPTASSNVPAFQTVNANTADTFSVTLPGTYVISGNIVMGVGSSAQPFNLVANSGSPVTISTPVPGTFPNNVYDFAEFSYDSGGLDTDLTEVDQAGMPYTVTTANSGISYQRGITQDLTTLQSLFTQYMTSTSNAADFRNLYQPGDLRILSPKDYLGSAPGTDPLNSYFNSQLLSFFNYYQTHTFSLDYSGDGTFTGGTTTISSGGNTYTVLQLSNSAYPGQYFNIYEPFFSTNTSGVIPNPPPPPSWLVNTTETPGQMVFGQDGVFNSGGADTSAPNAGYLSDVENAISSAFNRGIAASMAPDDWANAPLNLTASVGNSGSPTNDNLVSGTPYYYVITAVNGAGETVASNEVTATPTGATPSVTLNWTAANGPSQGDNTMLGVRSYNIYRGTSLGQEVLIGNASNTDGPPNNNPLVSFTDTGLTAQSPTVTPPAYYATGSTSNYYAAFLHQNSTLNPTSGITVNGLAYGFPYDDQGGNSTNVQLTTPATATITLVAWSNSTSASPTPTPTPTPIHDSLPAGVELLFLAEDQFALTLDSMMAMFGTNPLWTQAADHLMMALNNLLHLDNPALGTGLVGLQSAIQSNPLHGTLWAYGAQGFGLSLAASLFTHPASRST
jgi:hypothetical protein